VVVMVVNERCCNTEITQKNGTVIVNKEVGGFDIAVDEFVHMEIVETFKSLLEYASYNFFFHATWPPVSHDIRRTSLIHQAHSNI
jgi:hypothetical protein